MLVVTERPIKGQPQISLFDVRANKLAPKLLGRFRPPIFDEAPQFEFTVNSNLTRLYYTTYFIWNETYSFSVADISNFDDVHALDSVVVAPLKP